MMCFAAFRPRMIATATPIAATIPYLMQTKSTNPNKIRNVRMAVAVIPADVLFDFIKFAIMLHLTFGFTGSVSDPVGAVVRGLSLAPMRPVSNRQI